MILSILCNCFLKFVTVCDLHINKTVHMVEDCSVVSPTCPFIAVECSGNTVYLDKDGVIFHYDIAFPRNVIFFVSLLIEKKCSALESHSHEWLITYSMLLPLLSIIV